MGLYKYLAAAKGESPHEILLEADSISAAQNKLLKTLGEAPKNVVILLGATNAYALLPAVRSRVKALEIPPFTAEEMKVLREEFGIYGIATGRIAMAGFTAPAIEPAARAFAEVLARRGR